MDLTPCGVAVAETSSNAPPAGPSAITDPRTSNGSGAVATTRLPDSVASGNRGSGSEAERAGARDHEHGDEALDGGGHPGGAGIDAEPDEPRERGDGEHHGDEIGAHDVGQASDGRP